MTAYIKFEGLDGASVDKDHKKWSDLMSFDQAIHQPGGGAVGQAKIGGTVVLEDISCTKLLDKSSPKLAESVCLGHKFPKVEIEMCGQVSSSGRATYYRYELKNVLVTSYQVGGAGQADEPPMESFSLNFEEIKVTFTEYGKDGKKGGNVEYGWKVEEGEA